MSPPEAERNHRAVNEAPVLRPTSLFQTGAVFRVVPPLDGAQFPYGGMFAINRSALRACAILGP